MFRLFFTRILLKLLKIPYYRIEEKRIKAFLWIAYPHQGFQDYITKRDMTLLQQLGMGVSREEYLALLGQRTELGLMLQIAKREFNSWEKERKMKVEQSGKIKNRKILTRSKNKSEQRRDENIKN